LVPLDAAITVGWRSRRFVQPAASLAITVIFASELTACRSVHLDEGVF
jgi:hypothetical protein